MDQQISIDTLRIFEPSALSPLITDRSGYYFFFGSSLFCMGELK